jgi:LIVCS family branched-chain amino acid:cation transporter
MSSGKLKFREYLFVGSMLFGLFFGAGNLIFPVKMGQNAGSATPIANFGFLLTAVGLPFMGILAMGMTNSSGIQQLSSRVGKKYSLFFTILLYATIGPFFALPRLATTGFTIGIEPFTGKSSLSLVIFSGLFFGVAYLFSRKPSKLIEYVGKWLNPAFLLFLTVLIGFAFWKPLGTLNSGKALGAYASSPFFQGITDGYNTMDVLASLAFGVVVISTLKDLGLKNPKEIAKGTCKSGIVVVILMGVIYTLLSLTGAMSVGQFKPAENGGIVLAQLAEYYLHTYGAILLSIIVILCTLKTTIGLITSIGEAAEQMNSKISYQKAIIVCSILPAIFANVGLNQIVKFSTPILLFLYPLAITLVLLALLESLIGYRKSIYQWTTILAMIVAILDALKAATDPISGFINCHLIDNLVNLGSYLPLFNVGMGWVIPALAGLIIGFVVDIFRKI